MGKYEVYKLVKDFGDGKYEINDYCSDERCFIYHVHVNDDFSITKTKIARIWYDCLLLIDATSDLTKKFISDLCIEPHTYYVDIYDTKVDLPYLSHYFSIRVDDWYSSSEEIKLGDYKKGVISEDDLDFMMKHELQYNHENVRVSADNLPKYVRFIEDMAPTTLLLDDWYHCDKLSRCAIDCLVDTGNIRDIILVDDNYGYLLNLEDYTTFADIIDDGEYDNCKLVNVDEYLFDKEEEELGDGRYKNTKSARKN